MPSTSKKDAKVADAKSDTLTSEHQLISSKKISNIFVVALSGIIL